MITESRSLTIQVIDRILEIRIIISTIIEMGKVIFSELCITFIIYLIILHLISKLKSFYHGI